MRLLLGDCLTVMAEELEANSVDAIVTDPPYGLEFMGKEWDSGVPGEAFWREAIRVAKPGAHMLAFGGTRKFHRLMVAIEDAGWELRDTIMWTYGNGFPKSLDVSKAIDKAAGADRGAERPHPTNACAGGQWCKCMNLDKTGRYSPTKHPAATDATTEEAKQWEGWGTALKPAWEPVIVARKPLEKGLTVAQNVLKWGTGAINVDGCRVEAEARTYTSRGVVGAGRERAINVVDRGDGRTPDGRDLAAILARKERYKQNIKEIEAGGRWPANLIHDGSEEVLALFPETKKGSASGYNWEESNNENPTHITKNIKSGVHFGDSGSAARFFYTAKASKADRGAENTHPTVKPTALMRYLCRLVTPPGGIVLDPFMGSGSTGKAAELEGFDFVGIELEESYYRIAESRLCS